MALEVAQEGAVLLKNDQLLPFSGTGKTIAVIGPTASSTPTNGISAASVCAYTAPAVPCTPTAPLDSITARAVADGGTVVFDNGSDLATAAAVARAADVAVVFGYYHEGEFNDRPNLSLDGDGDALISAVVAANAKTVVVLQTCGPVLMPWLSQVRSVLEVWSAGQKMGPAITSLLWGDVNPSGKLTHSFPKSQADLPTAGSPRQYPGVFSDGSTTRPPGTSEIRQVDFTEGLKVGYRWYDSQGIEPLFPFGHGLSYTHFKYSKVTTKLTEDGYDVAFKLTNTGQRAGTEVAQVYVGAPAHPPAGLEFMPKLLGAFARVTLEPGESEQVRVHVPYRSFEYWSVANNRWEPALGTRTLYVGASARDLPLQATIHVGSPRSDRPATARRRTRRRPGSRKPSGPFPRRRAR